MAYTDNARNRAPESRTNRNRQEVVKGRKVKPQSESSGCSENVAYATSGRLQGSRSHGKHSNKKPSEKKETDNAFNDVSGFIGIPTQPAVRHRDDGLSDNMARLKALGNAVVPQIPELIGRAIMEMER